jgi:hypothetical protein
MASEDRAALAAKAFIYGFPLVFDLEQVGRFSRSGVGGVQATPFNRFGHATALAGPSDTFVSINNDTVYSIAQVDVSAGPVRLDVPATNGRYYVLQFVDAWTNNFAYVGHRATGTQAGSFILALPADAPASGKQARVIRFPTALATIVGRWAVQGEDDLPAVRALQDGLKLTPGRPDEGIGRALRGLPGTGSAAMEDIGFFERMRVWMEAFPPAERDLDYQARFAPLGLLEPRSPYVDPDPALLGDLRVGLAQGKDLLERSLRSGSSPRQNGWQLTYHVFDYNLDFFEIGTLDDPQWKQAGPPEARYAQRAASARGGLWGNHGYEAAYAAVHEDADGRPLNGSSRYQLHFDKTPPVGAFWSVTMYDTPDFYLVDNPIGRYSIGDRTAGLRYGEDGALTLFIQAEPPATPEERANWLPAPAGDFRPILRMYEPGPSVFDGGYQLPAITRRS